MENIENKKTIVIFSTILVFSFITFSVFSEKLKVEAKLEKNKDLISKSKRIKVLEKNNKEISKKIKEIENQKTLLKENK